MIALTKELAKQMSRETALAILEKRALGEINDILDTNHQLGFIYFLARSMPNNKVYKKSVIKKVMKIIDQHEVDRIQILNSILWA